MVGSGGKQNDDSGDGIEPPEAADGDGGAPPEKSRAAARWGWRAKLLGTGVALLGAAVVALALSWPLPALWLMDRLPADGGGAAARLAALEAGAADRQRQLAALRAGNKGQAQNQARLEQALAVLEGVLEGLRKSVARLQNAEAGAAAAGAGQADRLAREIARLRGQIAGQARRHENLSAKLAAGEERLAALEEGGGAGGGGSALALAVAQLSADLAAGRPFAATLAAAAALAKDPGGKAGPALAVLRPLAESGVATPAQLQSAFAKNLRAVLNAEDSGGAGGVWQRTLARVKGLVLVRRTGEVAGTASDAVLARAEVRMKAGNLAAAVAEMAGLAGKAAQVAEPWLEAARARLAADAALAELRLLAISRLAKS